MSDFIHNMNDHFTYGHAYHSTYRGTGSGSKVGKIVNVSRESHLVQAYDVALLNENALLKGVRLASPMGGFNGNGSYIALEEGTLVLVTTNDGMLDDSYIIGMPYLEGNHTDYYQNGNLAKPGDLGKIENTNSQAEFNQPFGHPNRITQPDAYFKVYGAKNISSDYNSPEFTSTLQDKVNANPLPGSIEMRNTTGDLVQYTIGANITYSDSNIISVSSGDNETKCSKLIRFADYHQKRSDLYKGLANSTPSTNSSVNGVNGIKPLVQNTVNSFNPSSLRSPFTTDYYFTQEKKLADLYRQAAQSCNQGDTARQQQVTQLIGSVGSELPASVANTSVQNTLQGTTVPPNYKPTETSSTPDPNNYTARTTTTHKALIVLHETNATAADTVAQFQNPSTGVSYHALINLDGSITYLTDPTQRAFASTPSIFNGECELTSTGLESVDNFAYHIALETPADGLGAGLNVPTHSNYANIQYTSCAYLCSLTGVDISRITTHKYVDLNQTSQDPRSFDMNQFTTAFNGFPTNKTITFNIGSQ